MYFSTAREGKGCSVNALTLVMVVLVEKKLKNWLARSFYEVDCGDVRI